MAEREYQVMHRYQCHKIVEAAKIISVTGNVVRVESDTPGHDTVIAVPEGWRSRFTPESPHDLGYLVRYKDGFWSWSPTQAFVDGYTRLQGD